MPVELHTRIEGEGEPILFLHGLFGSGRNLDNIAKKLASGYQAISVDLRNHGNSSHAADMTYHDMAGDIETLVESMGFSEVTLLGHSMGGKVAMTIALSGHVKVSRLIILDIAPVTYANDYTGLLDSLHGLPLRELTDRKQADSLLAVTINDPTTRNFLLQNLSRRDGRWNWRINLTSIRNNIHHITGFPEMPDRTYQGPALFLGGSRSSYLEPAYHGAITDYFSNARIDYIDDAGHLVHIDQPETVLEKILTFFDGNN